jgi:hypothetical protein
MTFQEIEKWELENGNWKMEPGTGFFSFFFDQKL